MRQSLCTCQPMFSKAFHQHSNHCELSIKFIFDARKLMNFIYIFPSFRRIINCALKRIPDMSYLSTGTGRPTILNMVWVYVRLFLFFCFIIHFRFWFQQILYTIYWDERKIMLHAIFQRLRGQSNRGNLSKIGEYTHRTIVRL